MKKIILLTTTLALTLTALTPAQACVSDFYAKLPKSNAVYYVKLLAGGTKYIFPDAKTFFTYADSFGGIQKLENEDQTIIGVKLSETQNGGIMKYKPNSKKLITHLNTAKVYAVGADQKLHWIKNPEILLALGYSFADINDLAEAFFISYEIGLPISESTHLDGTIIRYKNDTTIYKIENGKKRKIVFAGFTDEAGNPDPMPAMKVREYEKYQLLEVSADIVYPNGEDLTVGSAVPSC